MSYISHFSKQNPLSRGGFGRKPAELLFFFFLFLFFGLFSLFLLRLKRTKRSPMLRDPDNPPKLNENAETRQEKNAQPGSISKDGAIQAVVHRDGRRFWEGSFLKRYAVYTAAFFFNKTIAAKRCKERRGVERNHFLQFLNGRPLMLQKVFHNLGAVITR